MLVEKHIKNLSSISSGVITANSKQDITPYLKEWRKDEQAGKSDLVLLPANTEEVSKILKYCNENKIAVYPQGGNTGLVGGSTPDENGDGIVLSLSKMNKLIEISKDKGSVKAEAGVIIDALNTELKKVGVTYPISFGATGTAQIGGSIATNAGGANAIKYGVTRDLVIGLEVVLASGGILNLGGTLKDTAGLSLIDLIIGSEGTLGVITKVEVRAFPIPKNRITLLLGIRSDDKALEILSDLKSDFADNIETFEYINKTSFDSTISHWEFERPGGENFNHEAYLLIELIDFEESDELLTRKTEKSLEKLFDKGTIENGIIANSLEQRRKILNVRESISEASRQINSNNAVYFDIAVPVYNIPKYLEGIEKISKEIFGDKFEENCQIFAFGHLGDGNIHTHILNNEKGLGEESASKIKNKIEENILDFAINELNGTGWAEHGIGKKNKVNLKKFKNNTELNLMQKIKNSFDSNNILNPSRIFG